MVGLIHTILFNMIESLAGPERILAVKHRAGVPEDKQFHIDEAYADDEWRRLLAAACETLNVTQEQAEEVYADAFCKDALKRWPTWFQMSKTAREFLERQPRIHNGFATAVQDPTARKAITDKFRLDKLEDSLVVHYCSPNQLCGLYKALARWIINYYGETASIEESHCLKRGDDECEIRLRWV